MTQFSFAVCAADPVVAIGLHISSSTSGSSIIPVQVTITPNGRLSLPENIRERLGVTDGGTLLLEETGNGVMLRTIALSIAHAQALAARYTGGNVEVCVDAFLANRRQEPAQ